MGKAMNEMFSNFTKEEQLIVNQITERAYKVFSGRLSRMHIQMDISATHKQCPLKLNDLLNSDDSNFTHDIFGIYQNLNRNTGELENCFLPRFAQPESEAA